MPPATQTVSLVWALIAGSAVMSVSLGIRQTFGLLLGPFEDERGTGAVLFAFAVAVHNLSWGLAQPVAGAIADHFGTTRVVAIGAVTYAAGLALAALAPSDSAIVVGLGVLTGIGTGCTAFGVVVAAIGRMAPSERRGSALGIASAGGSVGSVALVPAVQVVLSSGGVLPALLLLAGLLLAVAPLGSILDRTGRRVAAGAQPEAGTGSVGPSGGIGLRAAMVQASRHRGYQLLTLGFFTCGFQLAFIATHLPGYLVLCHLPAALGAMALALVGFFNVIGSWACGWLGVRFRPQIVLAWLYAVRGVTIILFLVPHPTEVTVVIFAVVMGLTWLGTVPLTNGVIARMFGVRNLGALFGVCFLSHQVGSFLGAWLGGYVFALTGSYTIVWILTAAAGVFAAAVNAPIRDRPRPRVAAATP